MQGSVASKLCCCVAFAAFPPAPQVESRAEQRSVNRRPSGGSHIKSMPACLNFDSLKDKKTSLLDVRTLRLFFR